MVPPQVIRVGSKKVGWANAKKSCRKFLQIFDDFVFVPTSFFDRFLLK